MNWSLLGKFIYIAAKRPLVTLRLVHPVRIINAWRFLMQDQGNLNQLLLRYQKIYQPANSSHQKKLEALLEETPTRGDIFFFPVIDWHFRYQRPQHLATHLGELGYRIFYISTTPLIGPESERYRLVENPTKNVFLCQLRAPSARLANLHTETIGLEVALEYAESIKEMQRHINTKRTVALLNHFFWAPVVSRSDFSLTGYDCMDIHGAFHDENCSGFAAPEIVLINDVDFVTVSSEYLHRAVTPARASTIVRNGTQHDIFKAVNAKQQDKHPIAGYVGAIAEWFDIDLLMEVAKKLPNWTFLLVGATVGCDVSRAKQQSNIIFIGEVGYDEVPYYLEKFDICLIPFKLTELTKATNPVKVYEYLSTGRPVVSTALPEVVRLGSLVTIVNNAEELIEFLQIWHRDGDSLEHATCRREWAARQDWSKRALQMSDVIEQCFVEKNNHIKQSLLSM